MSAPPIKLDRPLVLASTSPQRRELLSTLDVAFDVVPSPHTEPVDRPARVSPAAWAVSVAHFKGCAVQELRPDALVLAADTVVAVGRQMLGKAADAAEVRRMLAAQAGRESAVITGVSLTWLVDGELRRRLFSESTRVWMRAAPVLLDEYIRSGDWRGKAGAYGIQSVGDRLVERIEGSFSNVVGLPLERVATVLRGLSAAAAVA